MKTIQIFLTSCIIGISLLIPTVSFAQLKVTTSATVSITEDSTSTTNSFDEKVAPILNPVKKFFLNSFSVVESWRTQQQNIWTGIKTNKRAEIAQREIRMDAEILGRSEKVLNEEQSTVVTGAGDDFDGSIFLLKIYVFVLSIFVFIFTYAWLFYIIAGIIVFNILRTIYEKIMDWRRTSAFK
jgi:hypothetical protein